MAGVDFPIRIRIHGSDIGRIDWRWIVLDPAQAKLGRGTQATYVANCGGKLSEKI